MPARFVVIIGSKELAMPAGTAGELDQALGGLDREQVAKLAGHQDLATTQRHMHLSPAALDAAIRLLKMGTASRGGILEAAGKSSWGNEPKRKLACQP